MTKYLYLLALLVVGSLAAQGGTTLIDTETTLIDITCDFTMGCGESLVWDGRTTAFVVEPVSPKVNYILEYTTSGGPPSCGPSFSQLAVMVYKTHFEKLPSLEAIGKRVYAVSKIGATGISVYESRKYTGKIVVEVNE